MPSSIFGNFNNIYDGVWPVNPDTDERYFSKIIQDNEEFTETIVDNVYDDQPYQSTVVENPDYNR